MRKIQKLSIFILVLGVMSLAACTSGGGGFEGDLADALKKMDESWELYEIRETQNGPVVMIEVNDNVTFKQGEEAKAEVTKLNPEFKGMLEFYNSEVGMTIRRVDIFPGSI
ncbi:MAG: hypothetical protein OEY64_01780 [Nitrospinota bacterium]|nr:hypothetical protein [Nitrospinota bacterium]